jgi:hypothetical protein
MIDTPVLCLLVRSWRGATGRHKVAHGQLPFPNSWMSADRQARYTSVFKACYHTFAEPDRENASFRTLTSAGTEQFEYIFINY